MDTVLNNIVDFDSNTTFYGETIVINNDDYFYMMDNLIRGEMMTFEANELLPKAERIWVRAGSPRLETYPIEGYYYKSNELTRYFQLMRNFQQNENVYPHFKPSVDKDYLVKLVDNELWGTVVDRAQFPSPFVRRKDILTLAMEDPKFQTKLRPWDVPSVMETLDGYATGNPNLVELAYLTNNVHCLLCGAETNALYRMWANVSGSMAMPIQVVWQVSEEVEAMGKLLAKEYNRVCGFNLVAPTKETYAQYQRKPELPRKAVVGYVRQTEEFYIWTLDSKREMKEHYVKDIDTISREGEVQEPNAETTKQQSDLMRGGGLKLNTHS